MTYRTDRLKTPDDEAEQLVMGVLAVMDHIYRGMRLSQPRAKMDRIGSYCSPELRYSSTEKTQ